jgi:hypothetical protein
MSQTQEGCFHNNILFIGTHKSNDRTFVFSAILPLPAGILTWSKCTSKRPVKPNLALL